MLVTRQSIEFHFLPILLALLIALTGFVAGQRSGRHEESRIRKGLVRVIAQRDASGLMHEGRYISQVRVKEVDEFNGIVVDERGSVATYLGEVWPKLTISGVSYFIGLEDGSLLPAKLAGIDERIALAVITGNSQRLSRRVTVMGAPSKGAQLELASVVRGKEASCFVRVVGMKRSGLLPEVKVTALPGEKSAPPVPLKGGFLFDTDSRFIGVVVEGKKALFSESLLEYEVIPASVIRESVVQVCENRSNVKAGWLGVSLYDEASKINVKGVDPKSPADLAGLLPGDQIEQVNGVQVGNVWEFSRAIRWRGPGNPVRLTLARDGRSESLEAVLGERSSGRAPMVTWAIEVPRIWGTGGEGKQSSRELRFYPIVIPSPLDLGFVVEALTPQLAEFFGSPDGTGLLLKTVVEDSPAWKHGFKAGDVLLQVNGKKLISPVNLEELVGATVESGVLVFRYLRGGEVQVQKLVMD